MITSSVSRSLKIGLLFLGVWPNAPYATVKRLIYMSSILIMQYFHYLYIFNHLKLSELPNLLDNLPVTLEYSLTFLKLAILWMHQRVIDRTMAAMDADWRECVNFEQHLNTMTTKASISHSFSDAIVSVNTLVSAIYFVTDYTIRLQLLEKDNNTSRILPIKLQFPFNWEESPVFELLVVILLVHVMSISYTLAIFNALMFTMVIHVSGQIEIVCKEIQGVCEMSFCHGRPSSAIRMLIERHNRVISFSDNIDKIFCLAALMQVIWDTFVICSLGLGIMESIYNDISFGLVKTALAFSGVMLEIFIFCFAGEYLSHKSKSITDAAYDSLWYDMSPSKMKNIQFMIMRSQKPLTLTAARMTNLSLEAFTNIMKASLSYMSVLFALY